MGCWTSGCLLIILGYIFYINAIQLFAEKRAIEASVSILVGLGAIVFAMYLLLNGENNGCLGS